MRQVRHALIPSKKFIENRNAGVNQNQKRRGHWNDSEYKNARRGKNYRKKQKHRIKCAARSNEHHAPHSSQNVKRERKRAANHSAQNVEKQEFVRADFLFANRSENQKSEHIADEMRPRAVHKHISENLPIIMSANEKNRLQAENRRRIIISAAARKDESEYV